MGRTLRIALLGLALAICGTVPAQAALTPTINTFPSSDPPSSETGPYAIAAGSDGALWFTKFSSHGIGRITVDGRITLQAPLPVTQFPYGIAAGSDGAMWFVSQGISSVSRIDAAGNILTKELASATANPTHITSGPEGALWFTEGVTKAIGRIPAATPLAVPDESRTTEEGPNAIAAGSDGNLWFTEYSASKIGRMTPAGAATYFPLPAGFENPEGIAAGPEGALWFTALNPPTIVRIATDGTQRPFPLPKEMFPNEIAAGPDGALWFAAGDEIGRITTGGSIEGFPLPTGVGLNYVTPGPDGNVWFTEANVGRIGRITTPPNATTGAASEVQAGQAKIAGTVNGHSQPTDVTIEYGPVGSTTTTARADPSSRRRRGPAGLDLAQPTDAGHRLPLPGRGDEPDRNDGRRVRRIHDRAGPEMPDQEIQPRESGNPDGLALLHVDQLDQRRGQDRPTEEIGQAVPLVAVRQGPRKGREREGNPADQAEEGGPQTAAAPRAALDQARDEAARRRRDHRVQQDRPRPPACAAYSLIVGQS